MSITNKEGLTEEEWYAAACVSIETNRAAEPLDKDIARKAWRRGEDPTDWAAEIQSYGFPQS